MTEPRYMRLFLRVMSILVLGFIYVPLLILAIYAFNSSRIQVWPPSGFTLDWFAEAARNPAVIKAVGNSILAASTATLLALILGTLAALAVQRFEFFGKQTISFFL